MCQLFTKQTLLDVYEVSVGTENTKLEKAAAALEEPGSGECKWVETEESKSWGWIMEEKWGQSKGGRSKR